MYFPFRLSFQTHKRLAHGEIIDDQESMRNKRNPIDPEDIINLPSVNATTATTVNIVESDVYDEPIRFDVSRKLSREFTNNRCSLE